MRRISLLRKPLLGLIYASAMFVWVAIVLDTAGLVQQATTPPAQPTATAAAVAVEPTTAPRIRPRPTSAPPLAFQERAPSPEQQAVHPKTGRYVSAWLPNSFDAVNRQSFEQNADILDEVSPFWYQTDSRGNLYYGSDARDQTLVELAHSKNVLVIPSIHNVVNGSDPVPALLRNPDARARHIENIVDEVLTHNYDGFDIDYEMLDESLRDEYSAFMVDLSKALHEQNKLLTVAVHAKTCDYCGLGGFQDWAVLGPAVDRLRIMTYDYSWRGGGVGPVAPVYWVSDVAEYAQTVVDPAKVIIGVPFYGYDWAAGGGDGRAYNWTDFNAIIQEYGLEKTLVESNANGLVQENRITYTTRQGRRTAYFATSRSLDAKLDLVQQLDLAGIAIWRLGGEDPENWTVIRRRLVQDPFESQRMINQVLPEH